MPVFQDSIVEKDPTASPEFSSASKVVDARNPSVPTAKVAVDSVRSMWKNQITYIIAIA